MSSYQIAEALLSTIKQALEHIGIPRQILDKLDTIIYIIIIVIVAILLGQIIHRIILKLSHKILKYKSITLLSNMIEYNVLKKISLIIPPIIAITLLPVVFQNNAALLNILDRITWIYIVITMTASLAAILTSIGETAFTNERFHDKPIKGFVQITKIIIYCLAAIIIISILTNKSPVYLIGGLGAFAAVLMLVFKDSILGFVGGILLLENDMIRLGDWIEVPSSPINGVVTDITLTIVKVQNFDNTIATIPPYSLINNSFINWRGMSDSGGRRIERGYTLKLDYIKPCNDDFLEKMKPFDKELGDFITLKQQQAKENDIHNTANPNGLADGSIETNAGLFRAYAFMYLNRHPLINKKMLIMVRTMAPTENGLPIEFYCFTSDIVWSHYESIQSEIMEHFSSVLPFFELYPFQNASSRDYIINGLIEKGYPLSDIGGIPWKSIQ